jgi:hypothetical protein
MDHLDQSRLESTTLEITGKRLSQQKLTPQRVAPGSFHHIPDHEREHRSLVDSRMQAALQPRIDVIYKRIDQAIVQRLFGFEMVVEGAKANFCERRYVINGDGVLAPLRQ